MACRRKSSSTAFRKICALSRRLVTVTVNAASARPVIDVTLSYLTTGLSWKADYVAMFDEKQSALKLQGWVTLTNNSGTSYKDARTQLVAGDINIFG